MNEIARKKAEITEDNREWSYKDAIEDALARLANADPRKVHLIVLWREELADQTSVIRWSAANLQRHDHISLLEMAKFEQCKEWFGYGE